MRKDYSIVIDNICKINNMNEKDILDMLKNRENKYLLLLMLRKYNMFDKEIIKGLLQLESTKGINYNLRKAEEKFFINRNFREKYLEIDRNIEKII